MDINNIINEEFNDFLDEIILNKDLPTFKYENIRADESSWRYRFWFVDEKKGLNVPFIVFLHAKSDGKTWEIAFKPEDGDYETKTKFGSQFKLMATITKIIKEFIDNTQPNLLKFSPVDGDAKRGKLYMEYVKGSIGNEWDYFNVGEKYYIERKINNINPELIQKILNKLHMDGGKYETVNITPWNEGYGRFGLSHHQQFSIVTHNADIDSYSPRTFVAYMLKVNTAELVYLENSGISNNGSEGTVTDELKELIALKPADQQQRQTNTRDAEVSTNAQATAQAVSSTLNDRRLTELPNNIELINPNPTGEYNFQQFMQDEVNYRYRNIQQYLDMIKGESDLEELKNKLTQAYHAATPQNEERLSFAVQETATVIAVLKLYKEALQRQTTNQPAINEDMDYLDEIVTGNMDTYEFELSENYSHFKRYHIKVIDEAKGLDTIFELTITKLDDYGDKINEVAWSISFKPLDGSYADLTNMGVQYKLMATIVKAVKDFHNQFQPYMYKYHPVSSDVRRAKLYMQYVNGAIGEGYKLFNLVNENYIVEKMTINTPVEIIQNILYDLRDGNRFISSASDEELHKFYMTRDGELIHFVDYDSVGTFSVCKFINELQNVSNLQLTNRDEDETIGSTGAINKLYALKQQPIDNNQVSNQASNQALDEIITGKAKPFEYIISDSNMVETKYKIHAVDISKNVNTNFYVNFHLKSMEEKIYEISFRQEGGMYNDVNNFGIQYQLMTTIVEVVKAFTTKNNANGYTYEPIRNKGNTDDRRAKLYMEYIKGNIGNDWEVFALGDNRKFNVEKKTNNIPKATIQKLLNYLAINDGAYMTLGIEHDNPYFRKFRVNMFGEMIMKVSNDNIVEYYSCYNFLDEMRKTNDLTYVKSEDENNDIDIYNLDNSNSPVGDNNNNNSSPVQAIDEMIKLLKELL